MMGIEIAAKPGPIPRELLLKLVCDGDHGLLANRFDIFEGAPFPEMMTAAKAMGWKETYVTAVKATGLGPKVSLTRLFLCPECGGKVPK
jgi:hypothetical protein